MIKKENYHVQCWGNNLLCSCVPEKLGPIIALEILYSYACAIKATHGHLQCWYHDSDETLLGEQFKPRKINDHFHIFESLGPFISIKATLDNLCAVKENGALLCWQILPCDKDATMSTQSNPAFIKGSDIHYRML